MAPSHRVEDLQKLRAAPQMRQAGGKAYIEYIGGISRALGALDKHDFVKAADEGALDQLDPRLDTLPYLVTLYYATRAQFSTKKSWPDTLRPQAPLWAKITLFLERCDPVEIRFAGNWWREVVQILLESSEHTTLDNQQVHVLPHVADAMLRLDPSGSMLTTTHLQLVRFAHGLMCPPDILPILEKEITNVPPRQGVRIEGCNATSVDCPSCMYIFQDSGFTDKISLEQVQEYFVLGALAYISVQNWQRAIFLLEHVLATPMAGLANGYIVEAYKKWLLLNLILHGYLPAMPRTIPQSVLKHIRNISKPYEGLKDAFAKADGAKLLAEAIEGEEFWREDGNVGLVQRLLADHKRRSVTKLGSVFAAVALETVAERLQMPETQAQSYLSTLVHDGAIDAKLEQSSNSPVVLRFQDDSGGGGSSAEAEGLLRAQLVERTKRLKDLADAMSNAEQQLSLSKAYIEHTRKARRNKAERHDGHGGEHVGELAMASALTDEDEELMGDT